MKRRAMWAALVCLSGLIAPGPARAGLVVQHIFTGMDAPFGGGYPYASLWQYDEATQGDPLVSVQIDYAIHLYFYDLLANVGDEPAEGTITYGVNGGAWVGNVPVTQEATDSVPFSLPPHSGGGVEVFGAWDLHGLIVLDRSTAILGGFLGSDEVPVFATGFPILDYTGALKDPDADEAWGVAISADVTYLTAPEPSTLCLAGAGALFYGGRVARRRRRAKSR